MHSSRMKSCSVDGLLFSWDQCIDEVNVEIPVPSSTHKADVSIQFGCRSLGIQVGEVSLHQHLADPIVNNESFWYLEDNHSSLQPRLLRIVMVKSQPGRAWTRVFVDQSGSFSQDEEEEARKRILLERFSIENPGFDFSQAQFEGACIPDARSFMGGFTL